MKIESILRRFRVIMGRVRYPYRTAHRRSDGSLRITSPNHPRTEFGGYHAVPRSLGSQNRGAAPRPSTSPTHPQTEFGGYNAVPRSLGSQNRGAAPRPSTSPTHPRTEFGGYHAVPRSLGSQNRGAAPRLSTSPTHPRTEFGSYAQIVRIVSFIFITINLAHAADSFDAGINAYHESQYNEAIEHFEAALTAGESAATRHNLALSYFQSEQLGEATWQLERATRLAPLNTEYQFKLSALRQQLGLYESANSWWQSAGAVLPKDTWVLIAAVCFWLVLALILIPRVGKLSRPLVVKLAAALSVTILLLSVTAIAIHTLDMPGGIVVTDEPATLRHAPVSAAPEAGIARPGERLRVSERYQDYIKVETEAEIVGWLPLADFKAL